MTAIIVIATTALIINTIILVTVSIELLDLNNNIKKLRKYE